MKNKNTIFWIIGIVILVALILNSQSDLFKKQETGMIGLTPRYYRDGVEVFATRGLFSVVTPPGGIYDQISFDISGTNVGNLPINLQITDVYIPKDEDFSYSGRLPNDWWGRVIIDGDTGNGGAIIDAYIGGVKVAKSDIVGDNTPGYYLIHVDCYQGDLVEFRVNHKLVENSLQECSSQGTSHDQLDLVLDSSSDPIVKKLLSNYFPITTQTLAIGETKLLWTSDLMNTSQFESISPVNFWIRVSAVNDYTGETVYAEGYSGDIIFEAEVEGFNCEQNKEEIAQIIEGSCEVCGNGYDENWDTYTYSIIEGHTIIQEDYKYFSGAYNIKAKVKSDDRGGLMYMTCIKSDGNPQLLGTSSFGIETYIFNIPSSCLLSGNIVTISNDMYGGVNDIHYYESALLWDGNCWGVGNVSYTTGEDSTIGIWHDTFSPGGDYQWVAQSFTPTSSFDISQVGLKVGAFGPFVGGNLKISIEKITLLGMVPSGIVLSSGTISGSSIQSSIWHYIDMSSYLFEEGILYALVIEGESGFFIEPMKALISIDASSPEYVGGNLLISTDQGNSWTNDLNKDMLFEIK